GEDLDRARELLAQPVTQRLEGARFDPEHTTGGRDVGRALARIAHDAPQPPFARRRASSIALMLARRAGNASSGHEVAVPDGARGGSWWTSRNRAPIPTAGAARAGAGTNSRCPPLALPVLPGSWTLWVASNTTGQPSSASTTSDRMSETRFW